MSARGSVRRAVLGAIALIAAAAPACVSEQTLARDIVNAARPAHLPLVVSCWEKEFEAADFRGSYFATVSFVVEADTSKIRDAAVLDLKPSRDTPERDASSFKACIEAALNSSALPTQADKDGPGFRASDDITVQNYRIEFVDASSDERKRASARQANVVLGPRADRCQGLYSHDPPRHASTLYSEIAAAEARAARAKDSDRDLYARELQKAYDAKLELRDRLSVDMADELIPKANKLRMKQALNNLEKSAKDTGALIGCSPTARPR